MKKKELLLPSKVSLCNLFISTQIAMKSSIHIRVSVNYSVCPFFRLPVCPPARPSVRPSFRPDRKIDYKSITLSTERTNYARKRQSLVTSNIL